MLFVKILNNNQNVFDIYLLVRILYFVLDFFFKYRTNLCQKEFTLIKYRKKYFLNVKYSVAGEFNPANHCMYNIILK